MTAGKVGKDVLEHQIYVSHDYSIRTKVSTNVPRPLVKCENGRIRGLLVLVAKQRFAPFAIL